MSIMRSTGKVDFNGFTIELGKTYLVNGRKAVAILAWVRDFPNNSRGALPNTDIRFKFGAFGAGGRTNLEDFNTVYGPAVKLENMGA
jgi:hypothetical protein